MWFEIEVKASSLMFENFKKFKVDEICSWRGLKLKKFEVEDLQGSSKVKFKFTVWTKLDVLVWSKYCVQGCSFSYIVILTFNFCFWSIALSNCLQFTPLWGFCFGLCSFSGGSGQVQKHFLDLNRFYHIDQIHHHD